MTEREFEYKSLLSEAEYLRLLSALSAEHAPSAYTQVNHYYDTPELLLSTLHATLRIREKESGLMLEYKHGQKRVGEMRTAIEDRFPITEIPSEISGKILPDCDDALVFYPLGSLTTVRADFKIDGCLVSLDKNTYLGITDYEIEVEVGDDGRIPPRISALPVSFSASTIGKFHRFLSAKREKQ